MNPEEKTLLERTYALVAENNKILRSIQRSNRIGIAVKSLYWILIIGLSVGAFYFIQPYVDFIKSFGGSSNTTESSTSTSDFQKSLQDLLQ